MAHRERMCGFDFYMRFLQSPFVWTRTKSCHPLQWPIIMMLIPPQPLRQLNTKLHTSNMLWKMSPHKKRLVSLTQIQPGFRKQTQLTHSQCEITIISINQPSGITKQSKGFVFIVSVIKAHRVAMLNRNSTYVQQDFVNTYWSTTLCFNQIMM